MERQLVGVEIAKMEEEFVELVEEQWKIINNIERERMDYYNKDGTIMRRDYGAYIVGESAKTNAAKLIKDVFETLFKVKFDAGVFERKLGELELTLPIGELVRKVSELTGENEFAWQKNKGTNKYQPNVEQKPTELIANGSGKNDWSASEIQK